MGATSWHYYTPYRAAPEVALQELRAEVFARRDYVDPTGSMAERLRQTFRRFGEDPDSPAAQARIDESLRLQRAVETGDLSGLSRADRAMARRLRWFGRFARLLGAASLPSRNRSPRSIEELLEWAEESGTHSILDIDHVARRSGPAVAVPMSPTYLRQVFGTTEPTHAQVEERWADVAEGLERWQCLYLAVYLDGQPHEYAFIGCSGD